MGTAQKQLDVICIGRIAIDLYGQQIGARLEDMTTFSKYLGGSSGNVAYGTAVQGLKSGMLARVGDEHMGRFLREELQRAGVDTQYLITDKERLTALVILGVKDQETFPLIFYRENCADMALSPDDIDESYIASSRAVAVTGTHLSHPNTRAAVLKALDFAKRHGLRRALDIDYRPVLWGLTSLGDGETRFISSERVTRELQDVLHHFDLIVGTEEEFHIAGGTTDTLAALRNVRRVSQATLVCKRGAQGCSVFEGEIPDSWDAVALQRGVRVEVLNVLGAGDAFMSGLLRGYLNGESWEQACRYANACGALVVSRHGCAPAMPTKTELDDYLSRVDSVKQPDKDPRLNHLHRVTTRKQAWPELCIFAFDHRKQLVDLAVAAGKSPDEIPRLKQLLLEGAREAAAATGLDGNAGILADTTFGQAALNDITGQGWWIGRPIELPSSRPLRLEHGDIGSQLVSWPLEHVVKCLVFYHPADPESLRLEQEALISEVYHACQQSGHELLLELILPESNPDRDEKHYATLLQRFYSLGVQPDWWKLPPMSSQGWQDIGRIIEENDAYCRGVLILGLDAPEAVLKQGFAAAADAPCVKGFAVGRTIFAEASDRWFRGKLDDRQLVDAVKQRFMTLIEYWRLYRPVR
ncbi:MULTISPECIES: bifunctional 5-dehydro-2-deoxygluconokinase/5-dehydro-2-deoxyphosphogluconate aldolase [unclassified Brenneria]|uniref:bifunctional 5-dehydro-2-deoxygluconokinase/5-dehydro-2- deoxyphosphogluconate aldolase n=1 Tax=unclassified Brenneria TaxID=2634434 RepID=UPI00155682FD|nr:MULTISPECIES: 5-dehydro-2-deoxygluconokinase [unclassified Brenneria]MBJ7223918.1 5-dehydro-2-deoxygluconokinase [Brenneria sp. L3-3C-1]MEE3645162.1 5-dehydro-2-deoxygluconokinase [Brenneria sp. L3_3C_1]MEE3649955.1 5-dehydro-2-deoxygluconokinase [Brenneria sp. HEZEL_4_2_4]NPC99913.1 5-dehydro-2-deoxygluconokinase [Brenneria sp. hezel4-2-4]